MSFGENTVTLAMSSSGMGDNAVDVVTTSPAPIQCEMLCFIRAKSKVMAVDDIVKVCVDFYREEEVFAARGLLDRVLPQRLSKRQGPNKCRATVEDIVNKCLDPNVSLPLYFAADLNRLPPVDTNHCDVSAILAELQYLRAEVRSAARLAEEVATLRQEVAQLHQMKASVTDACHELDKLRADQENFPPLHTAAGDAIGESDVGNVRQMGPSTYVQVAQELQRMGVAAAPRNKTGKKPVIGTSSSSRLKSVQTYRHVDIFVSRLSPHTTEAELANCIEEVKGSMKVHDITCEKLQSRYEHVYKSYFVSVRVESQDMKSAIDMFMAPDTWPAGVLVRRYFKPKNGSDKQ